MAYVDYQETDYAFRGTLKGNGYKILNYNVTNENIHTVYYPYSKTPLYITSLFLKNYGRIENITIDNFSLYTSITEYWLDLQNSYYLSVLTFENYGEIINSSLSGSFDCFIDADQPFSNVSILFNTNYGYIANTSVDCTANIIGTNPSVSYSQFGSYNYGRIENSTAYGSIYYINSNSAKTGSYSGFVIESDYSITDYVYNNLYDKWIPIYGEQGLYSCKSYTDIHSATYNRDAVCIIATASTSAIMDCKYSGEIVLAANSDDVLIDGVISGITGNINNSSFTKSTISGCTMSDKINLTINKIYDDGYPRTLAASGIVGEILFAKEETIISDNEFTGSIIVNDKTSVDSNTDNVRYYIAGIVGASMLHWSNENPPSHTIITNCKMSGIIEANVQHISSIDGIAAYLYRNNDAAGLVGNDFTSEISSCSFNGKINLVNCGETLLTFGGIAGQILSINLIDCIADGQFVIVNSKGAFFETIVGQCTNNQLFENGYTMSEIINCEGHVQATIDGLTELNGTAICEGYSVTFKYLCDYLGIDCIVVTSDEMDHAWNMVEVEGEWYYVDVTWADTGPNEYFLMGSDEFTLDHYAFNDYLNLLTASKDNYNF